MLGSPRLPPRDPSQANPSPTELFAALIDLRPTEPMDETHGNWFLGHGKRGYADPLSPSRFAWLCGQGSSAHHLGGDRWPR
jgi:hypothetical protein